METPQGPASFEATDNGDFRVATHVLPPVNTPERVDMDALDLIAHLQAVATMAVGTKMRLNLRGELVEGGSVLYGPGEDEAGMDMTDVYLTGDDDPEDAMRWVLDKQGYDTQMSFLQTYFPPSDPDTTWEGLVETWAAEATSAGLSLEPPVS